MYGKHDFVVDIGCSELASLSMMAFEGATKKQKPDLQVGDAVYARLLSAHREMEPELVCVDSFYKVIDLRNKNTKISIQIYRLVKWAPFHMTVS